VKRAPPEPFRLAFDVLNRRHRGRAVLLCDIFVETVQKRDREHDDDSGDEDQPR